MRYVRTVWLLSLFLVIGQGCAQPDLDALYQQARDKQSEGRYQAAIALYEEVAAARPGDVELHYWLGLAYWNRDDAAGAIHAYERAVAADTAATSEWSLYALENLAEVYTRSDRLAESQAAYERALRRETRPEWIEKIRTQLDELALALGTYQPDSNTVFNERGDVVGGVGPGLMHTNRAFEIARHTRDPRKEVRYYREALEIDPDMFQAYFNLGLALCHLGRYEEAVPWLEQSDVVWKRDLDYNPDGIDKADAHAFLALCHLELGNLEKAAAHAQKAVAADPNDFWATLYAARVQTETGNVDAARATLEGLAADNPEHPETQYALAQARLALGDSAGARDALGAAIAGVPDDHPWLERLRLRWLKEIESLHAAPRD